MMLTKPLSLNLSLNLLLALLLTLLLSPDRAVAKKRSSDPINIDPAVIAVDQLQFPNEQRVYPKISDFAVVNLVLMSSRNGERWAVVTLHNTAHGMRKFDGSQIMALFANGKRHSPNALNYTFGGGERITLSLSFGISKFPLLQVYTRKD